MAFTTNIHTTCCILILFWGIVVHAEDAPLDSCSNIYDSLNNIAGITAKRYLAKPTRIDSLYPATGIPAYQTFHRDAYMLDELLTRLPGMIRITRTTSSSLNRSLVYGFTAPVTRYARGTGFMNEAGLHRGTSPPLSVREIYGIHSPQPSHIRLGLHPRQILHPHLSFLWENGLFSENVLDARFSRPVTPHAWLSITAYNLYFEDEHFDHSPGDVYNFYKELGADTTTLMNEGYTPLTEEKRYTARILWDPSRRTTGSFAWSYGEHLHELHDILATDSLSWQKQTRFLNTIASDVRTTLTEASDITVSFLARYNNSSIMPHKQTRALRGSRRGLAWNITPRLGSRNDTLSLSYQGNSEQRSLYHGNEWNTNYHTFDLSNRSSRTLFNTRAHTMSSIGYSFFRVEDTRAADWRWHLHGSIDYNRFVLSTFGARRLARYEVPYDVRYKLPGFLLDRYYHFGTDIRYTTSMFWLNVGYLGIRAIDSTTISHAWWHGITPYTQPSDALLIAPSFGIWKGLYSRGEALFSSTRPYVKSTLMVGYDNHRPAVNHSFSLELTYAYWSPRDPSHAGATAHPEIWTRPMYELGLHAAIQIKSFRLFYKIDNILNRKIAYMPGYTLPGLTFRWGFNWYLPQ